MLCLIIWGYVMIGKWDTAFVSFFPISSDAIYIACMLHELWFLLGAVASALHFHELFSFY